MNISMILTAIIGPQPAAPILPKRLTNTAAI